MGFIAGVVQFIEQNPSQFWSAVSVHARLSFGALLVAMLIFIPIGVVASRSDRVGPRLVSLASAARVVPSLAVLFLLLPVLGTGFTPALVALTLLAGPPIVANTDAGLRSVNPAVMESARGLGMSPLQQFFTVQLPLAMPVLVAGIRTAAVEAIASATLAAFIGAGGLGDFILAGLTLLDYRLMLVGALPVTIAALITEWLFDGVEKRLTVLSGRSVETDRLATSN